jgi:LuxR family transcriptional regulator, maltose regulon positive regulatory protein
MQREQAPETAYDPLLQVKLHIPGTHAPYVDRPRLLAQFDAVRRVRLTLVAAPAGSGKTTLAGAWARQYAAQVAWLELEPADNTPARFWTYVLSALHTCRPTEVAPLLAALCAPKPPDIEAILTALLNALAALPSDLVLVLDDYHVIETSSIHRTLTWLIDHLPPQVHLVLVSRTDPPLPLGRWRARGQMNEIRVDDLRFTHHEAAVFLAQAIGASLADTAITQLDTRVEGWAAGLQLAALALRGRSDINERIAHFSGQHQYVLTYLVDEVLARQPEYVQTFLQQTSILDRLCGPLCDAVLAVTPSGSAADAIPTSTFILDYVRESNLFLVPLDDTGTWYRYHHLFRDVLRHRLRLLAPERLPALHRSAAQWYADHSMIEEAVQHALAADDHLLAARWIEQQVEPALRDGTIAPLQRWLNALPDDLIRRRPRLAVGQCWVMVILGQDKQVGPWIDVLETALIASPDGEAIHSAAEHARLRAEVAALRAERALHAGDFAEVAVHCRAGIGVAPADAFRTRGTLYLMQGTAERWTGDLDAAERTFATASDLAEQGDEPLLLFYIVNNCAKLAEVSGQLSRAALEYERMRRLTTDPEGKLLPLAGMTLVGLGQVARERNDLTTAERYLTEGIALGRQSAISGFVIDGLIVLALIHQARGDYAAARTHLEDAAALARKWHPKPFVLRVAAFKVRLAIVQGVLAEAEVWATDAVRRLDTPYSDVGEIEQLTLARFWITAQRAAEAIALLEPLAQDAHHSGRFGRRIEILALLSLAYNAQGDSHAALDTLAEALAFGQSEGYIRVFVDEGAPMQQLVVQVAQAAPTWPELRLNAAYLAAVRGAFANPEPAPAAQPVAPSPAACLVEPLSARETEVLRLVTAGCSNQEIADRLIISVATVRKHVENIHGKLGVQSRTQAAARARELGLA